MKTTFPPNETAVQTCDDSHGFSLAPETRPAVLVIDDDANFADLVALIIEGAGCRAVIANDGLHGLGLAAEISPALILCDYSMPGLSGGDVMRGLQGNPKLKDIARVLMSGYGCPDLQTIPADAFIAKPINTQSLTRLVRAFTQFRNISSAN
jgi:sigma-B regulation protein RsbU (phosphoserine phosphatase)